jgi:hypothetical protein
MYAIRQVIRLTKTSNITLVCNFSKVISRKPIRKAIKTTSKSVAAAAPDDWVSVRGESSGQIYWWNQKTDETTVLGAPKPQGPTAIQNVQYVAQPPSAMSGGMGLGGMMAQGMAFGVGSSVAHHAIGSLFGGGSSGHDSSPMSGVDSSSSDGGDSWDV